MPTDAYQFLRERHDRLATALASNTDVAAFVQATLEHIIDRAEARGISLASVEIESPQIVREGASFYVSAGIR